MTIKRERERVVQYDIEILCYFLCICVYTLQVIATIDIQLSCEMT